MTPEQADNPAKGKGMKFLVPALIGAAAAAGSTLSAPDVVLKLSQEWGIQAAFVGIIFYLLNWTIPGLVRDFRDEMSKERNAHTLEMNALAVQNAEHHETLVSVLRGLIPNTGGKTDRSDNP